jgi:hypothetical protein
LWAPEGTHFIVTEVRTSNIATHALLLTEARPAYNILTEDLTERKHLVNCDIEEIITLRGSIR